MNAMYLPRTLAGTISDTIACATGASPPTPTPIMKRQTMSAPTLHAAAAARLATPQTTIVTWNTMRRPKRSEAVPATRLPTSCPANVMAASCPAWVGDRPNSTVMDASRNVSSATSTWSTSQAEAMMANTRRW